MNGAQSVVSAYSKIDGVPMFCKKYADRSSPRSARRLPVELLDLAVSRILRAKFKLGLFENPYVEVPRATRVIGSREHRQLSLETAREGIVLLKNENQLLR